MKKIFLIILLMGLLGCEDTFSQDTTFLHCQNYKFINDKLGRVTQQMVSEWTRDRKLKLDLKNKELYEFNKTSDKYIKSPNVKWKDGYINYVWNLTHNIYELGELDTVNYTFKMSIIILKELSPNPDTFKSNFVFESFYNCRKL